MPPANAFGELLHTTDRGLYCPAGDFYVDPWRPVPRAVVTHAHADHARWGCDSYLAARPGAPVLQMRLGREANIDFVRYGESTSIGGVDVSLHPAGHMLGSAQVRLEHRGRVAVVTGDYKLGDEDPTCQAWQPVRCDVLVTESTFGLPIYRWPPQADVFDQINQWWRANRDAQRCSVLYGYAVGKSQRLLAGLDATIGPIYTHGAVEKGTQAYRDGGVALPATTAATSLPRSPRPNFAGAMVVAVPSAHGTPWMRRFGKVRTAMASGWMAIRGPRRRRALDRGFVLSDHVDWPSLLSAIDACDPETVWVTHGYSAAAARYLNELGRHAQPIETPFRSEPDDNEN